MMKLSRRDFLKLSGATAGGLLLPTGAALAQLPTFPLHKQVGETPTICSYCGTGCGQIVATMGGRVVNIEGDPDNPINQGSLCPKGSALSQLAMVEGDVNPRRLSKVLYRAPGSDKWEKKSWDWVIPEIAKRIKATRDANWMGKDEGAYTVNRTEAIAALGSVFTNNEEAYVLTRLVRALGVVYNENQSRICVASGVKGLGESLGRGPMTNHWIDLGNSDCIMVIAANAAATFPVSFKWITRAVERGAKLISVDPRFTRTSSKADIYVSIRSGTDIAFIGGMINYVLEKGLYHKEYVREYTNASFLINRDFGFEDGLFTGLRSSAPV